MCTTVRRGLLVAAREQFPANHMGGGAPATSGTLLPHALLSAWEKHHEALRRVTGLGEDGDDTEQLVHSEPPLGTGLGLLGFGQRHLHS